VEAGEVVGCRERKDGRDDEVVLGVWERGEDVYWE